MFLTLWEKEPFENLMKAVDSPPRKVLTWIPQAHE